MKFDPKPIIKFIRTYGPLAYGGSDEDLERDLKWYYGRDQLLIVNYNAKVLGVAAGNIIAAPHSFKRRKEWPKDDYEGKYLYVPWAVIHPLYQNSWVLGGMLAKAFMRFPQLRYIVFERSDSGYKLIVRDIRELLPGGKKHGKSKHAIATATT